MNTARGMALAVSLVLLLVLSLLALGGARLSAMDLHSAAGDERRIVALQAAQSALDAALRDRCTGDCAGVSVTPLATPALPPPAGTGNSADRIAARRLRLEAGDGGARIAEGLAILEPAAAMPAPAPACGGPNPPPRSAAVLIDGEARSVTIAGDGNGLTVTDAADGTTLWRGVHPSLVAAIVSPPALLDADADGAIDRAIVGDLGGTVWRADLTGPVAQWRLTLLARLDGAFYAAPDLVQARDDTGPYVVIAIGSGDAAHPLDRSREDFLYLFEDRQAAGADREPPYEVQRVPLGPAGTKLLSPPLAFGHRVYFVRWTPVGGQPCDAGEAQLAYTGLRGGEPQALGAVLTGAPPDLRYAGDGGNCEGRLAYGGATAVVPGCSRFRTFWQRVGA